MLLEIEGSLSCHCDTLRMLGEGYRAECVLLSMFGHRNAVRAAWATLLKSSGRRGRQGSIVVGGTRVGLSESIAYATQSAPLERGLLHAIFFHPMLSHNAPDLGYIYQVGPGASERYFARLARWCPVPLRATWRSSLWELGRRHGAITEVSGHGRDVWHVATTREAWEPIVSAALLTREIC